MTTTVPLSIIEIEQDNFHVFITIRVGRRNARLLLDTGASKTVFDEEKALKFIRQEKIVADQAKSVGLGAEAVATKLATLYTIRIGGLKIGKIEVAVLNLMHVNTTYKLLKQQEIDGVLGSDLLVKYHAVINYRTGSVSFKV